MPNCLGIFDKFRSRTPSPARGASSIDWGTIKNSLVLALKATETALDGLPIPGAKTAVTAAIAIIEQIDVSALV